MRHKDVAGYDAEGSRKNLDLWGMHLPVWFSQFRVRLGSSGLNCANSRKFWGRTYLFFSGGISIGFSQTSKGPRPRGTGAQVFSLLVKGAPWNSGAGCNEMDLLVCLGKELGI